jgi:hypothetical protein
VTVNLKPIHKILRPNGLFSIQRISGLAGNKEMLLTRNAEDLRIAALPNLTGVAMANELSIVSTHNLDHDLYTSSHAREHALNTAIVHANIGESFEEYLEIFDEFYADDVEVRSETEEEPVRGKARVRSLLATFLVPLHIMAEIGGVLVSVWQTAIPGDTADETHSAWTLELVGISGRTCAVSWRALRKWNASRIVYEYHYDHQQSGGPLTSNDLSFYPATSTSADQQPS